MLVLVGLGLDTKDLTLRGFEAIRNADTVYLETYTSFAPKNYIAFIEKEAGKHIETIERHNLEDDLKETVALAKKKDIAILVPGDPLIATTHSIILNEARKQHVKTEVFHSPNVFSVAIGESGLDVYKFGPTATLPFWSEHYKPVSFLDVIRNNMENKEHTLLLFDIDQKNRRPMTIREAIRILTDVEAQKKTKTITKNLRVLILGDLGKRSQRIIDVKLGAIGEKIEKELEGKVLSIIIPSRLTFAEEESLQRITKQNQ